MSLIIPIDERLALRLVQPQHAEAIAEAVLSGRDSIARWMPWCHADFGVEDTRKYIAEALRRFGERAELPLSIVEDGRVVGGTGFWPWENVDNPAFGLTAATGDIGYWLSDMARGRGLATRATAALCDYGFGECGMHRIQVRAEADNAPSRAVPERLGFTCEGTLRRVFRWNGRWVDHRYYSMLADEWPDAKAAWLSRYATSTPSEVGP